ncbi:hypothetical protein L6164_005277 [Bauhinia variegata]|uniref:Uncharacterized protein n=1 Tax=Bauhinia variegata TaxID=167791 RepID=A0ACB9PW88_BAUVA|nr:hypothetical protein L6164_005277 [Bauhinia variegata]
MCYSGVPFGSEKGGWLVFPAPRMVVLRRVPGHAPTVVTGEAAGGTSDEGGSNTITKWCLCSPSQHPGSFRCRQHRGNYVWRGSASSRRRVI